MKSKKHVGIWLRVSTDDQVEGDSLEVHEHRARSYAESKDWEVAETYRLEAVSGKKVVDHPEAKRMLADIASGKISGLIFSKLARLSRNNRELLQFSEIFQQHDADLVSLAESIDTSTPAGRMFYNMLAAMANWEREEIAARVQASVPIRAKMGKPLGGPAPFGYQWVDKKLVIDPSEATIRKLIYELYQKHRRRRTVARLLNEMGHRTRKGAKWSDTTVERLLRDTTAIGKKRANYSRQSNAVTGAWEYKPEAEWVYHEVEPIVSEELYYECVGHMDTMRKKGKRIVRKSVNLFMGYAHCGCGTKMHVPSPGKKYVCKTCKNRIPKDILEECFLAEIANAGLTSADLDIRRQQADQKVEELSALIDTHNDTIGKVDRDIDTLLDLYQKKALDEAEFKSRYEKHKERKQELAEELPRLLARKEAIEASMNNAEKAIKETADILEKWNDLSRENKRLLIETVLQRVDISEDEIEFTFLYESTTPPASSNQSNNSSSSNPPTPSAPQRSDMKATQPCRCGHLGDAALACSRAPKCAADYQAKVSGPLLDRIDLHIEVEALSATDLTMPPPSEGSGIVASRVRQARQIQSQRFKGLQVRTNTEMDGDTLEKHALPDDAGKALLAQAAAAMRLSARGYTRVLKVARTIADLSNIEQVNRIHIAEALSYRRQPPIN